MYFKYLLILCSLIFPSKIFAYSFDQKTSDKEITRFYDFSKMPNYYLPHKYNTTKKAAQIENETLKVTVEPGMRGSTFDKEFKQTERALLGFKMPINGTLYYSFVVKTPEGFKSVDEQFDEVRTMITQVKTPPATHSSSPPVAVYVSDYGSAKCLEYKEGPSRDTRGRKNNIKQISHTVRIYDLYRIDLNDRDWHKIEITLRISKTNGYCKIVIDGQTIIEKNNLSNLAGKIKYLRPQIGIYRDNLSYNQTVYFDDLKFKFTPE